MTRSPSTRGPARPGCASRCAPRHRPGRKRHDPPHHADLAGARLARRHRALPGEVPGAVAGAGPRPDQPPDPARPGSHPRAGRRVEPAQRAGAHRRHEPPSSRADTLHGRPAGAFRRPARPDRAAPGGAGRPDDRSGDSAAGGTGGADGGLAGGTGAVGPDSGPAGGTSAAGAASPMLPTERADILDRNGVVLATSLATASLYANPHQISDAAEAAERLVKVLPELSEPELAAKLGSDHAFVWLKRNLTPRQQYAVNRLGIPGLYFQAEERRVYPQGSLVAHVVGFTDIDNRGLGGIEQSFDEVLRDGHKPVQLSIDIRLQHMLREELTRAMTEYNGIGAAGLVMDCRTGELLAMVSLPDFDPNDVGEAPADAR